MNSLVNILDNKKDLLKPAIHSQDQTFSGDKITPVNSGNFSIEDNVIENNAVFKYQELARKRFNNQNIVAVNNLQYMVNDELVLPEAITKLIDNPMYLPRYKKLARLHGVDYLLQLSELARLKNHWKPSHWFAKSCSVENWQEKTLDMLNKLFKKMQLLKEKLQATGYSPKYFYYYLKAFSKLSEGQFNKAIEQSKARWIDKPPNMLTWSIKQSLQII